MKNTGNHNDPRNTPDSPDTPDSATQGEASEAGPQKKENGNASGSQGAAGSELTPREQEMQEEIRRLNELVRAFSLLNSTLDLEVVLLHTLNTATKLMKAEMGSIALINEEKTHLVFVESTDADFNKLKKLKVPIGKGIAGYVAQTGRSVRVEDVNIDNRFYKEVDKKLKHTTRSYLCVPLIVNDELIGTAQIMNRSDGLPFTEEDESLMNGFARQAALAIQNARLYLIMMKQQALDSELRVCSDIQTKLFPSPLPAFEGYELYGESVPCKEVGGDYFTFITRPDGTMDAIVADVSGKGLSAAMLVSDVHTGIHLLSRLDYGLEKMVDVFNTHLQETLLIGKFVTFFAVRLEPHSGRIRYVNAGHLPPYIVNAGGEVRELHTTGAVLGLPHNWPTEAEDVLNPGDLLVAFSDGLSEAQNAKEELFGEERISQFVRTRAGMELRELAGELKGEIDSFRHGHPVNDDSTLLLLRKK